MNVKFLLFILFLFASSVAAGGWLGWRTGKAFFPRWRVLRWVWFSALLLLSVAFFVGFRAGDVGKPLRLGGAAWVITLPYWLIALAAGEGMEFGIRRWRRKRDAAADGDAPGPGVGVGSKPGKGAKHRREWRGFFQPGRLSGLLSAPHRAANAELEGAEFEPKEDAALWPGPAAPAAAPGRRLSRAVLRQRIYWLAVFAVLAVILLLGHRQFLNPVVTRAEIRMEKPCKGRERLRIALASDLHLGEIIGRAELAKYVDLLNSLNADLILLAGDLVDSDPGVLAKEDMGAELRRLKAPLGVFAVLGNHDIFFDGGMECATYFRLNGVRVLRDEVVPLDKGAFLLAGRRDLTEGDARKPLSAILRGTDPRKPLLVLDHQPKDPHLREGAQNKADLYLSGHTHGGQVWPITWLLPFLYKVPYGAGREGDMHVRVTSGLGLWGFPVRIGSTPEIVDLTLHFPKSSPFSPADL